MNRTTKIILITGATAGIGREAALSFARAGHHVIATGRSPEALARLRSAGARLDVVRLDVTDAASIESAAREVERLTAGEGLDVLINNAGYGQAGALFDLSDADLRRQFDTNVFGLMATTRAFLPGLIRRRGRILNVSSVGGRVTFPMFGAYHASKYALEALSDALRRELLPFGVEVAIIEPGPIHTEFAERTRAGVARYGTPASPYAEVYRRAGELEHKSMALAIGPEAVVRAMDHAILARRPRARYVVPGRLALVLAFLGLLPTRAVDWIMARFVGLDRAARPALPQPQEDTLRAA